jgi:hypothetical protein
MDTQTYTNTFASSGCTNTAAPKVKTNLSILEIADYLPSILHCQWLIYLVLEHFGISNGKLTRREA